MALRALWVWKVVGVPPEAATLSARGSVPRYGTAGPERSILRDPRGLRSPTSHRVPACATTGSTRTLGSSSRSERAEPSAGLRPGRVDQGPASTSYPCSPSAALQRSSDWRRSLPIPARSRLRLRREMSASPPAQPRDTDRFLGRRVACGCSGSRSGLGTAALRSKPSCGTFRKISRSSSRERRQCAEHGTQIGHATALRGVQGRPEHRQGRVIDIDSERALSPAARSTRSFERPDRHASETREEITDRERVSRVRAASFCGGIVGRVRGSRSLIRPLPRAGARSRAYSEEDGPTSPETVAYQSECNVSRELGPRFRKLVGAS